MVPSEAEFDPAQHLTYEDIAVDDKKQPSFITVNIKQSKTDPFRRGVTVVIGRAIGPICPLVAILSYMARRKPGKGPLFCFEDGRPLTRERFVARIRKVLQQIGIDQSKYSGHSFRIGAATTAARSGIQDSLIKTLGRWGKRGISIICQNSKRTANNSCSYTRRSIRGYMRGANCRWDRTI